MSIDLEPCPFCGGPGEFTPHSEIAEMIIAGCADGDCAGHAVAYDFVSRETAANYWNTRAPTAAARERDGLREALDQVWNTTHPSTGYSDLSARRSVFKVADQARAVSAKETPHDPLRHHPPRG